MTKEEFAQKVTDSFCEEITDLFFLHIEKNSELMHDYLRMVSSFGLDDINQTLGAKIKQKFHVENIGRSHKPKSKLIKSYTQHTAPIPTP